MLDHNRLRAAYEKVRDELLAERTPHGHWVGELSSSALSTATAISALAMFRQVEGQKSKVESHTASPFDLGPSTFDPRKIDELIQHGITWLTQQQNDDGGFGDTDLSHSNIATTYLAVAALHLAGVAGEHADLLARADRYIEAKGRLNGLRERYGIDKTFVVPIMTNLALAGLVDWKEIDPLPFELACVPQSWYRFVGMPVVSYAIPALVAIGQARYYRAPPRNPVTRLVRRVSVRRSLQVLRRMQPESGGYLEATPLTSFVVMSLASEGVQSSRFKVQGSVAKEVIREGVKFLVNSARPDGSWPIDTNLATWNTTLSVNALAGAGEDVRALLGKECLDWLLSCQHRNRHPFTGAESGGFAWSDLSGAVPDADDTPGASLAVEAFHTFDSDDILSVKLCIERHYFAFIWLVGLQNRDGGWPTFCRGWGKLPFDRSGSDLTAHALRALRIVRQQAETLAARQNRPLHRWLKRPQDRGLVFLQSHQRTDGSWSPLWFGNQDRSDEDNPVYGTAKVLMAYRDLGLMNDAAAKRGITWLAANQNADGGWGSGVWGKVRSAECGARSEGAERPAEVGVESLGEAVLGTSVLSTKYPVPCPQDERLPASNKSAIRNLQSSIEETALAVEALLAAVPTSDLRPPTSDALNPEPREYSRRNTGSNPVTEAVTRGLAWLIDRVEHGEHRQPAPIGFYFAKLWYYEKLYPLIFTTAALGRACRQFARQTDDRLQPETASSRSS